MSEHNLRRILAETEAKLPSIRTHEDGKAILHEYLRRVARDKAETTFLHITTTPGFTAELAEEVACANCLGLVAHTIESLVEWNMATPERARECELEIVNAFHERIEELFLTTDDGGRA